MVTIVVYESVCTYSSSDKIGKAFLKRYQRKNMPFEFTRDWLNNNIIIQWENVLGLRC